MTCISYPGTLCTRMHANRVIWLLSNLIPEKFRFVFLEKNCYQRVITVMKYQQLNLYCDTDKGET